LFAEAYHWDMTEAERSAIEGRALLLYDGVCGLCNGVVRLLLRHDKLGKLRYAPMQSALGCEILARFAQHSLPDGVVLVTDVLTVRERLYRRSDAVAVSLQLLSAPWRLLGKALMLVPRWLRERSYGIVARLRYRLFGRYTTCPVPLPNQRSRMLGVYE
jgi:predicted DCC family thiol-disulfide oxidoreductase YuxK